MRNTQKRSFLLLSMLLLLAFSLAFAVTSIAFAEENADVVDFSQETNAKNWEYVVHGSSGDIIANRPAVEYTTDGDAKVIKIPNDAGVNWSMATLTMAGEGNNNVEYKFKVKFSGNTYSGLLGQISIFSTGIPARWGNNSEFGTGLHAQFWDGHTVVLYYRTANSGSSFGDELGRIVFHNNQYKDAYINFYVKLTETENGTYATVRAHDSELANNYFMEGVTGKGKFGFVSGNGDADMYIAPYNYYSESGLAGNSTPAVAGDNMQEFINKGYPSTAWANTGSSSVVENGVWKLTSNNGLSARLGGYHYSTVLTDTVYNYKVKVEVGAGDPNYNAHTIAFYQRLTGDLGAGQITSAYGIWFHSGSVVRLFRYAGNRDGKTQLGNDVSFNLYDGNVHDISFGTKNVENGVLITVYLDGTKKIEYTDTAAEAIKNAGQFAIDTHEGSDVYYIAGYKVDQPVYEEEKEEEQVPTDEWVKAETILNIKNLYDTSAESAWITTNGNAEVIASTEGGSPDTLKLTSDSNSASVLFYYAGAGARQFEDYTMSFKMKQEMKQGMNNWGAMITLRDSAPGSGNWDSSKPSGYDVLLFSNRVCLREINNGAAEISGYSYQCELIDGQWHEWAITIKNVENGVQIVVYIDGVLVFNYTDTENAHTEGGYVSFFFGEAVATTYIQEGVLTHTVPVDSVPPVITVSNDKPTTGVVGEEISLPVGVLSDNVTDPALMIIERTVTDPNGDAVTVKNRKFTPTVEGDYTVTYTATDEAGNDGSVTWTISVVKGSDNSSTESTTSTSESTTTGCFGSVNTQSSVLLVAILTIAGFSAIINRKKFSKR